MHPILVLFLTFHLVWVFLSYTRSCFLTLSEPLFPSPASLFFPRLTALLFLHFPSIGFICVHVSTITSFILDNKSYRLLSVSCKLALLSGFERQVTLLTFHSKDWWLTKGHIASNWSSDLAYLIPGSIPFLRHFTLLFCDSTQISWAPICFEPDIVY